MTVHFINFITVITQTIQLNKFSYKISQGKRKKHTSKTLISTTYYWTYSIWSGNIFERIICVLPLNEPETNWQVNPLRKSFLFSFWFIFNRTNMNGINNQKIVFYKNFLCIKSKLLPLMILPFTSERFFRKIKYMYIFSLSQKSY